MYLVFINAYTKFYQNSSICSEDIQEIHVFTSTRAITLLFINKFSPFAIPNHSSLISMSMQSLKKIGQKLVKLRVRKQHFYINQGSLLLLFINEISPFAIPNHSSPISMSMLTLKKIGQELLKLRVQKRSADGRTDTQNFKIFRGYYIIPATFCVSGYNEMMCVQPRLRSAWAV